MIVQMLRLPHSYRIDNTGHRERDRMLLQARKRCVVSARIARAPHLSACSLLVRSAHDSFTFLRCAGVRPCGRR